MRAMPREGTEAEGEAGGGAAKADAGARDKRVVGAALSLLLPGAGLLALGHVGWGIFWATLPIVGAVSSLVTGLAGMSMLVLARVGSIAHAVVVKPHTKGAPPWSFVIAAWVGLFAAELVVGFTARKLVAETYNVPAGSMIPTLLIGDYVVANKAVLRTRAPRRGEVVVMEYPSQPEKTLVKRVIGLGGDTIAIKGGVLLVNGKPAARRPAAAGCEGLGVEDAACERFEEELDGERYEIIQTTAVSASNIPDEGGACPRQMTLAPGGDACLVPPGHAFVVGDNRDNSFDSRSFGAVKVETIFAKPTLVWLSLDAAGGVRWDRIHEPVR
jgi:signal peptidase I